MSFSEEKIQKVWEKGRVVSKRPAHACMMKVRAKDKRKKGPPRRR